MAHRRHGRRRPYTSVGISRVPCFRCGGPSRHQWQICADGGLYRTLCGECDVLLNEMVLAWMGDPEAEAKGAAYRARARAVGDIG